MRIFSSMVTDTPMRPSSSIIVVTSCRCGTLETVTGPSASRHPARIGSVAFLAPEMRISPSSGMPPWICSLSTRPARSLAREFLRREHLERERVDLAAHGPAEGRVDQLMALHGALRPANAAAITTASKCTLSSLETEARLPGNPRWMRSATLLWIHAPPSSCIIRRWILDLRTRASSISGARRSASRSTACAPNCPDWGGVCTRLPHLSRLPRAHRGHRHGQVRPHRRQDRRHSGEHRHTGLFRASRRGQPRRCGHDHAGRRRAGAVQFRRNRRDPDHRAGDRAPGRSAHRVYRQLELRAGAHRDGAPGHRRARRGLPAQSCPHRQHHGGPGRRRCAGRGPVESAGFHRGRLRPLASGRQPWDGVCCCTCRM